MDLRKLRDNSYYEEEAIAVSKTVERKDDSMNASIFLKRRLTVFGVVFLLILLILSNTLYTQTKELSAQDKKAEMLNKQLNDLREEEVKLMHLVELLKKDDYIMDVARKEYLLSKKDEIIFVLPTNNE